MPKSRGYVLVLWGNQFEEAVATIFVTQLREAGLRVKLVGLTPRRIRGSHGLALVPDLSLDQALSLAANTICVIIPYATGRIKRLKNDPRLRKLLYQAHTNKAKFVIGQLNGTDVADLGLFPAPDKVIVYPDGEDLVGFVSELAGALSPS